MSYKYFNQKFNNYMEVYNMSLRQCQMTHAKEGFQFTLDCDIICNFIDNYDDIK